MLVGAAAEQPRRASSASRSFFRGHRGGDTGEIEPVPGEDEEIDPEELRYAPRAPRRFVWLRRIALLLVLLLVVGAVAALGYRWTQDQYYVAAHQDRVTIFRGVQADVPGLTMHRVAHTTSVTLESLPDYPAEQVRSGIGAEDLGDAHDIVSRLTGLATVCPTPSPSPSPSPKNGGKNGGKQSKPSQRPSAKPSSGRTPSGGSTQRAAAGPTKKPSGPASPSASPTPTIKPPDCIESTP
jgi:protein phosphatase